MYRKLPVFPEVWSNDFELFKLKSLYDLINMNHHPNVGIFSICDSPANHPLTISGFYIIYLGFGLAKPSKSEVWDLAEIRGFWSATM